MLTLLDALGLAGLLGMLTARFIPVARLPFWGCAFRHATGLPCPGCGLTRVADRLAHFNVRGALDANPLGTLLALGFCVCAVFMLMHFAWGTRVPRLTLNPRAALRVRTSVVSAVVVNYAWCVVHVRFPGLLG